ncbi:MAG: phosphoenolpyruvate synthase [Euryarchaeota archaeon]|nr:phosphoenolpyruvate synthase [Euryarchaeota archaeon]
MAFVAWFDELAKTDVKIAGGKGANLGELTKSGFPVPPGFVVIASAYSEFLDRTNLREKIFKILKETNVDNTKALSDASDKIRKIIIEAKMPDEIRNSIIDSYKQLSKKLNKNEEFVAIRSSATFEDLPSASFAGQQESYLNIKGPDYVAENVQKCWASLFTPRAIFYREKHKFDHSKVNIAVVVQKMVEAEKAGVIFTVHPATGEQDKIVIESTWGLGESVVSGSTTPDRFVVWKATKEVAERDISRKEVMRTKDPKTGKTVEAIVPKEKQKISTLSELEISRLAELAEKVEQHYSFPQDIEWAVEGGEIYLLQSRPVTVLYEKKEVKPTVERKAILRGLPASPGIASGPARLIPSVSEISKVKSGDILVTKMTAPDWVSAMSRASAIVTEDGGMTCHAAIVARELGIPCVVGTGNAMSIMKDSAIYSINASAGVVYEGVTEEAKPKIEVAPPTAVPMIEAPVTGTKIYMNLGVPEKINEYANLPFDGIGLMRIEFIIASYIYEHPNLLLEKADHQKYIDKLAEGIATVARKIQPRPVVVRFSDFKTNEYRALKGGEKYEPVEANPMIGWRGCSRYVSEKFEGAFRLECRAVKKCREEFGLTNVWVMLPFVRTTWEVERCLEIMKNEKLVRSPDFKVWLMAEVPSIVFMADEFSKLCDGFSIGSNDLTQLILGADRDSEILGKMGYFDERDPAVKRAIKSLIETSHKHGVSISICGQGPSVYPEFTEFLVECGIDSISINPDAIVQTRKLVASIETKIIMRRLGKLKEKLISP